MGSAPRRPKASRPEKDKMKSPARRTISAGRTGVSRPGSKAGPGIKLNGPRLAQVVQALFDQEQNPVAYVGADSRIRRANRALAELLCYSQEELAGKALDGLIRGPWKEPGQNGSTGPSPGKGPKPPAMFEVVRKSGDSVACHVDSRAIRDGKQKVTNYLVFFSECAAPKDEEEGAGFEKEVYRRQALQTLGMLAGGVAHDFNNALEVIIGFASLARIRISQADPLHEPLKIIEESANSAADLARRLLDVSKDDADDEAPVDAGELLDVVLSIITRTFDRKIRISHRISSNLPSVQARRSRLQQAILNLCLNARDAMPKGGTLFIEASLQTLKPGDARLPASCAPGHYVCIAVRDSGQGMPSAVMKKIFVPQFTTKGRGYGQGLAMVDRIVKEAQGFIAVTSQPGRGSEFSLYLPAVFHPQQQKVDSRHQQMVAGRGRVLVVDDEPRVLEFLEKGLTRLGYRVVTAENGGRACEIYSKNSEGFNCVLLDLIMPGMSGMETYARLKAINPGVKVILSSGYSSGRVKREAVEAGSPEFLEKPFTLQELSQAMRKIQQN